MTVRPHLLTLLALAGLLAISPALAQGPPRPSEPSGPSEPSAPQEPDEPEEEPEEDVADTDEDSPEAEEEGRDGPRGRGGMRSYDRVITEEAVTEEGIFKVHQIGEDLYYEIPNSELGREFLWVSRISKTAAGAGYGGEEIDERIVRWVRHDDRIFLENVSYEMVADEDQPISLAVRAANNNAILLAFDIATNGPNEESVVIDVTNLFASEVPEFSARSLLQARGFDRRRSYISDVAAFPENIEVRAVQTFTRSDDGGGGGGAGRGRGGMPPGSATIEVAFSMVKLPDEPMMPRLFDERVGYFTAEQTSFTSDQYRAERVRYITRWRLEKQDPEAEVSDPVKPIEFWIDPATPTQWVPYVKSGIESWQSAFEAAGFSNAIIAREAPSEEEDPDWSPEDARYSVIRWLPSTVENASGPHVHDPRTGEILEADIEFHHNVQNLVRDWYFVQAAPLDPRARTLPLPDELMGRLLEFVIAHEVGHTLGLQHNMKASSTYPMENLRDRDWLEEMGHTPTIMDYARFNYVAQPEDDIPPDLLIPSQGPYDLWAIQWGYAPIPDADSPEEERPTLDDWARDQETTPWYRFSTDGSGSADPGELTEAVGDSNAIEATRLGLLNLERVMDLVLEAGTRPGENWDELEDLYGRVLGQWVREMGHVAALVGGFNSVQTHGGQEPVRFTPVETNMQREAVRFLNENAFATPEFMIRPEILRRIESDGILGRVRTSQASVLNALLDPSRFTRLVEQEALDPETYGPERFLEDLRRGIWSELFQESVTTDAFRRNLQRLYLTMVAERVGEPNNGWNDMRASLRGQLKTLEGDVRAAINRAADAPTRYHLEDVRDEIEWLLDPAHEAAAGTAATNALADLHLQTEAVNPDYCWPDLVIIR